MLKKILLNKLGNAKLNGDEIISCCPNPEHEDNSPSFTFNTKKCIGYCHSEGRYISLKELMSWLDFEYDRNCVYNNINTLDIKKTLKNKKKNEFNNITIDINGFEHNNITTDYLIKRGFNPEELYLKYKITGRNNLFIDNKFYNAIVIPYIVNKKIIFLINRVIGHEYTRYYYEPKSISLKDKVWGLEYIDDIDNMIICEGIFNTLTWMKLGYKSVCILGSKINKNKIVGKIGHRPILNFDLDNAGIKCYNEFNRIFKGKTYNLLLKKDANEYLIENKIELLLNKLFKLNI